MVLAISWTHKDYQEFASHNYTDISLQYLFTAFLPEQHSFVQWQNHCDIIVTPRSKEQHKEGCCGIKEVKQVLETGFTELGKRKESLVEYFGTRSFSLDLHQDLIKNEIFQV